MREYKKQTLPRCFHQKFLHHNSLAKRERKREREKRNDAPSVYHHRLGRRSKSFFERIVIARGQKVFFSRGYKTRPLVVLLLFFFFFESVVVSTNSSRESLRCFFFFVRRWQPKESDGRDKQKRGEAVLFGDSWSSQSAGFRDAGETPGRRGVADEIL